MQYKEHRESLKEWWSNVFLRWWGVLGSLITLVGLVGFVVWGRSLHPPIPLWDLILVIGGVVIFSIFSYLSFHHVRIERDNARLALSKKSDTNLKNTIYLSLIEILKHLHHYHCKKM